MKPVISNDRIRTTGPHAEEAASLRAAVAKDGHGHDLADGHPSTRARKRALLRTRPMDVVRQVFPLVLASISTPALAHSENGVAIDFWGGFTHPIFGPDHVIAMVAVGLWGAFLGAPAIWLLPVVFPLVMAVGGALGVVGMPLPGVETGIAISAIMLGGMVAFAAKPPLWIAAALVGAFAVFHGHAHGAELPIGADAVAFSMGFVVATGTLHLAGIGLGGLSHWPAGRMAVRLAGGVISLLGFAYLGKIL